MCQSKKDSENSDLKEKGSGPASMENTSSSPTPSDLGPLRIPGSQIHREPMPSPQVEKRPSEKLSSEKLSSRESPSESSRGVSGSSERPYPDGGARPLRDPVPEVDPGGTELLGPRVSGKMHQSHRWLRLRNLFAEHRFLLKAGKGRGGDFREGEESEGSCGEDGDGESSGRGISLPKTSLRENSLLNFRTTSLRQMLLREALAASQYRDRSKHLRAALTGRDRRASIVGKGGILFYWVLCHLGEPVGSEEWSQLGDLLRPLLSAEPVTSFLGIGKALRFVRRHLLARQLASEVESGSGPDPGEVLPPAPEQIQKARQTAGPRRIIFRDRSTGEVYSGENLPKKTSEEEPFPEEFPPEKHSSREVSFGKGLHVTISFRLREERKKLIEDNVRHSGYADKSKYMRSVALGWDRSSRVLAQCAEIARWAEAHLGDSITEKPIGQGAWAELDKRMVGRFGKFLFGGGGEKDVDRILREGAQHLLGMPLETVAEETGIRPEGSSLRGIAP